MRLLRGSKTRPEFLAKHTPFSYIDIIKNFTKGTNWKILSHMSECLVLFLAWFLSNFFLPQYFFLHASVMKKCTDVSKKADIVKCIMCHVQKTWLLHYIFLWNSFHLKIWIVILCFSYLKMKNPNNNANCCNMTTRWILYVKLQI